MTSMFFVSRGKRVEASNLRLEDFDDEVSVYSLDTDRGKLFFEVPYGTDLSGMFRAARAAYEGED